MRARAIRRYVISYYNSSFECEADYYKSKCVTDVSLSDDGKKILIVTIDTAGASFQMQTELYSKGSDTPLSSYSGDGMVPLDSEFFSDGSFAVICDKAVLFFDENGTSDLRISFRRRGFQRLISTEIRLRFLFPKMLWGIKTQ